LICPLTFIASRYAFQSTDIQCGNLMEKRIPNLSVLVALLLLAAVLRIHGLSQMTNMLHHDEAYYGIDAVSLVQNPRLTAYFPNNTGREGLWMYLLAPSVAIFGATPFALRLVSVFVGILSVAAIYPLAREFFGKQGAVWAVGAMAVLYWHVHLSHIAFRANTFPLVGALAMAALLKAQRRNRGWISAGLWLGLLLYTYIAARVWVAYAVLWLVLWGIWMFFRQPPSPKHQGRGLFQGMTPLLYSSVRNEPALMERGLGGEVKYGAFIALIIIALMSIPLLIALATPSETTAALSRAAAADWHEIQLNIQHWMNAWFQSGDPNPTHNLPERPVLDMPLTILTVIGVGGFWFVVRKKWLIFWWLGLVGASFIPTILSTATPHYLRGLGVLVPLALLIGAGGAFITSILLPLSIDVRGTSHRLWRRRASLRAVKIGGRGVRSILALLLLLLAATNTYRDFDRWLADYTPSIYIDDRFNASMQIVREQTPPDMPIMIPGIVYHPVAAFHGYGMPQRETRFYEWADGECYVTPRQTYIAVDLPIHLNSFESRVQMYSENVVAVARQPEQEYNVFIVTPHDDLIAEWDNSVRMGDRLEVRLIESMPQNVAAGDTLTLYLGMRVQQTPSQEYRFFVHLQGNPTPYEGGTQWSTGDAPLCAQVYNPQWDTSETIVQTLTLPIPDDMPAGEYHIAIGLYEPNTGTRLPITPAQNEYNYYELFRFVVE
jgi:hypothetical protein